MRVWCAAERREHEEPECGIGRVKPPWGHSGLWLRRRTRRRRTCRSCGRIFQPGDLYVRGAVPPGGDMGNERWWYGDFCGVTTTDCERYWEIDSKVLAGTIDPHDHFQPVPDFVRHPRRVSR